MTSERLIVVGNPENFHVGRHLQQGARALGLAIHLCDMRDAFAGPKWLTRLNWHLRGHRPTRLRVFSEQVVQACRDFEPGWLISTGLAPIQEEALREIGSLNVKRLNYLTDDPWSVASRASWFLRAIKQYDQVFSPRSANIEALRVHGCKAISYLPFAYAPEEHYRDRPDSVEEHKRFATDIVFAGGADRDRVPILRALIQAGFRLALYGGYWERFPEMRPYHHGQANFQVLRKAIGGARIALCLVRRANRDGHVMRSFEIPAIGGCMLTEDTEEHREIFGPEGEAVVYFGSIPEMVEKARWLLDHENERQRLAASAYERIISGRNTYQDRLAAMLA